MSEDFDLAIPHLYYLLKKRWNVMLVLLHSFIVLVSFDFTFVFSLPEDLQNNFQMYL